MLYNNVVLAKLVSNTIVLLSGAAGILILPTANSQLLECVNLTAQLPFPNYYMPVAYDGNDLIYLGPGSISEVPKNLLRYTISTDTLDILGTVPWQAGGESFFVDGRIYTIGGSYNPIPPPIYSYSPISGISDRVANISYFGTFSHFGSVFDGNRTIYTFGGFFQSKTVFAFDTITHQISTLPELPKWLKWTAAVWDKENQSAYIFSNDEHENNITGVVSFNAGTGTASIISSDYAPMETEIEAVWDGRHAYLLGAGLFGSDAPADGIYEYDPIEGKATFLQVRNFPGSTGRWFAGQAAVYVEKQNRIIYFGGVQGLVNPQFLTSIGYIDLTPINGKNKYENHK